MQVYLENEHQNSKCMCMSSNCIVLAILFDILHVILCDACSIDGNDICTSNSVLLEMLRSNKIILKNQKNEE